MINENTTTSSNQTSVTKTRIKEINLPEHLFPLFPRHYTKNKQTITALWSYTLKYLNQLNI